MRRVIFAGVFILTGYLAGASFGVEAPINYVESHFAEDAAATDIALSCLSDSRIEKLRRSQTIEKTFRRCRDDLRLALGKEFSAYGDDALKAILATVASARFANYGPSSAISFKDIAADKYLNCGNTILLAGFLIGQEYKKVRPIGFDGGYVGNHAQLLYIDNDDVDDDTDLLLDPTYGIAAITSFNDLLRGKPVPKEQIRRFAIKDKSIEVVRDRVQGAIERGYYKPTDFMYIHETVASMYKSANLANYFTPAGIYLREKLAGGDAK